MNFDYRVIIADDCGDPGIYRLIGKEQVGFRHSFIVTLNPEEAQKVREHPDCEFCAPLPTSRKEENVYDYPTNRIQKTRKRRSRRARNLETSADPN